MPKIRLFSQLMILSATLSLLVLMGGCVVRPTQQPYQTVQTQSYVVQQPQQVVYTRPVVVQRPVSVVYRTAPIVYTSPSRVMTPVRVSVPSQVYYRNVGSQCVPGTSRQCYAYCGYGVQYCSGDGMSWGTCIEGGY